CGEDRVHLRRGRTASPGGSALGIRGEARARFCRSCDEIGFLCPWLVCEHSICSQKEAREKRSSPFWALMLTGDKEGSPSPPIHQSLPEGAPTGQSRCWPLCHHHCRIHPYLWVELFKNVNRRDLEKL
ncbi:hypothetical protein H1C71_022460, partial [Ictidomys tridecemlineatus]